MTDYKEIRKNTEINMLINKGNSVLKVLGFTDHSVKHAAKVAARAGWILKSLDNNRHDIELARIAGYMHDIGNCINRTDHAHSGALVANGSKLC